MLSEEDGTPWLSSRGNPRPIRGVLELLFGLQRALQWAVLNVDSLRVTFKPSSGYDGRQSPRTLLTLLAWLSTTFP